LNGAKAPDGMNAPARKMLIIADDLSGAADCAVACCNAGMETLVVLDADAAPVAEALAVDTDSRRMTAAEAATLCAELVAKHAGAAVIYKKMDSTARGHFAAEIAASLQQMRRTVSEEDVVAIVAPAFPSSGRTTRDGHQLLHGSRLEATDIWQHERMAGTAFLPDMLAGAGLAAARIGLTSVRRGGLATAMRAQAASCDALVCDAETDDDLRVIAEAGQRLGSQVLWVGSAGLARFLPAAAGFSRARNAESRDMPKAGPVLCAVGSLSAISREQFAMLQTHSGISCFTLAPGMLRQGPQARGWIAQHDAVARAAAVGDVAVMLCDSGDDDPAESLRLGAAMGAFLAPHVAVASGVIATGGETARAVLLAAGVATLRLIGEVEPGIPLSNTEGGLRIITKAGAFGGAKTLLECFEVLRRGCAR
jgi:4-hydroxythreonine-4-phosphate dehydrogenase